MNNQKYRSSGKSPHFSYSGFFKAFTLLSFLILVNGLVGPNAYAQIEGVKIGDRVRIKAPTVKKRKVKGMVTSMSSYQMVLSVKDTTYFVPYEQIQKVELSAGKKRNFLKGSLIGLASGAMVLGGLAAITNDPSCDEEEFLGCVGVFSNAQAFTFGALIGGVGGLFVGGTIGYFSKTTRWEENPVKISAGITSVSYKNVGVEPIVTVRFTF